METNSNTKSFAPKMNLIKKKHSDASLQKEKPTSNTIILMTGIFFSTILFIVKISWINIDWKTLLIPLIAALQLIIMSSALKDRYKKL
jgi:hypothetical protein